MFAEMRFHVGISRVVVPLVFFLGDCLSMRTPPLPPPTHTHSRPLAPLPVPPSTFTSIYFHFLNVAICSVTRPRLGWEAVGRFHRTWSCTRWCEVTGQRQGEFRERVISYLGETSWSAGCSVGPRGAWDVSGGEAPEKEP